MRMPRGNPAAEHSQSSSTLGAARAPSDPNFKALFEASPSQFLVLTPTFRIVAVSDAYLKTTSTTREEILGRGLLDVFPDNCGYLAALGEKSLRASLERVLGTRTRDTMAVQKRDISHPQGTSGTSEECYWSVVNSPVFDQLGEVCWIVHRVEEIAGLVRLKQQRTEQTQTSARLLRHAKKVERELSRQGTELQTAKEQLRGANMVLEMERRTKTAAARGHLDFLVGGREMGKVILAKDWSKTPLGPIENWPQSLRTTVSLCLASNFPISMAWGAGRVQIYNDGYWPICGAKHPYSMGQDFKECWLSAWPVIGDAFERAQRGETSFLENERMFLDRNGHLEETFFTFSFSPIRDETGAVGGLFQPVTETTARMLTERRTHALRDLAARAVKPKCVGEVCQTAAQVLAGSTFDLPFGLLYELREGEQDAFLAGCFGLEAGTVASPTRLRLADADDGAWPIQAALQAGSPLLVDVEKRFGALSCGPYPEPIQQAFVLPISGLGQIPWAGVMIAGVSTRLPLDDPYRSFYDLLAGHLASALANARFCEEQRRKVEALAELDRAKTASFSDDRKRAEQSLQESWEHLRLAFGQLQSIREDERARIAREIHDELGQQVTAIKTDVATASQRLRNGDVSGAAIKLDSAATCAETTINSVRRIASELRPPLLDFLGMVPAIEVFGQEFQERYGIPVSVAVPASDLVLTPEQNVALFRIAQESLTNVARHAKATAVNIAIDLRDGVLHLGISDNGIGFRTAEKTGRSLGLLGMEERARLIGAGFSIESTPGLGTSVSVRLPLASTDRSSSP